MFKKNLGNYQLIFVVTTSSPGEGKHSLNMSSHFFPVQIATNFRILASYEAKSDPLIHFAQ